MSCAVAAIALGLLAIGVFVGWSAWEWMVLRWGAALAVWGSIAALAWLMGGVAWRLDSAGSPSSSSTAFATLLTLFALGTTGLTGVGVFRSWREHQAIRSAFPHPEGSGRVGSFVVGGETLTVRFEYALKRVGGRWDGRGAVLRCRVAPESVRLGPPPAGLRRVVPLVLRRGDPGTPERFEDRVWLHEVALPAGSPVRVVAGAVEVRPEGWMTSTSVEAVVSDMAGVAAALKRSSAAAPERFVALATASENPAARRQAWLDLETLGAAELRVIARSGLTDPDDVIRAVAATAVGEAATLLALLRTSHVGAAMSRAARWALREGRHDLAPVLAARLGTPPEEAWSDLVAALGTLGGRAEMEALHAVREGEGFPKKLRGAAEVAMITIRHRLGPAEAGALALADVAGGEVSLAGEAGAIGLAEGPLHRRQ